MKKIILLAFAALACISLEAKSPFTVISGSTACFNERADAVFVIDYENALFQHGKTLPEESGAAWEERLRLMNEGFIEGFNSVTQKKNGLKACAASQDAKYTITLHISNIDRKSCPTFTWADMTLKIDGVVDIVENASGENVCRVNVEGFMHDVGYAKISTRISKSFIDLGQKLVKKAK